MWTSEYSCIKFHKLSIESKIIKIGVRSKKLWSKHDEADSYEVTGWSDGHRIFRCSKLDVMRWTPGYSCREFHKLSKDTRSSKSEFGTESNDQNTKHHKADFCEWPDDLMVTGYSDAQNLIYWDELLDILVDNFISFPKSTRSSKTEFGAESNDQNTKHHEVDFVSDRIIRPL